MMQIFLSYADSDKDLARDLARSLSRLGYRVWFADADLLPGDNWSLESGKALKESDAMVVLLTPKSATSQWQNREVQYALTSPRYQGRVISVLVPPTHRIPSGSVPWILNKLTVIESGRSISETGKRIARALRAKKSISTGQLRTKKYAMSR